MTANRDTLDTYEQAADAYADLWRPAPAVAALIEDLCERLPARARVLEIGSGPGFDADVIERRGFAVQRTDGARSFVEQMRGRGFDARLLDVTRDDPGAGYDAVFANAVLLHVGRDELHGVLMRLAGCVSRDGLLALTMKEGEGERWTSERLGLPRRFTYWYEEDLASTLTRSGWHPVRAARFVSEHSGEAWLHFICTVEASQNAGGR